MITFDTYQEEVDKACFYPGANTGSLEAVIYGVVGLNGEAGEVSEKVKKIWRDNDGYFDIEHKAEIIRELGDVLFYLTRISTELGYSLERVAEINVKKFTSRKERGTLQGSGDNR